MTDILDFVSDLFALSFGTLGTTSVTLGLMLVFVLSVGVALYIYRRIRGRG